MADDDFPSSIPPSGAPPERTTGGGMKWTPPSPEHLQRMLPQYEVMSMIGHGGMGAVYKARQKSLDRLVAMKILPPEAADDEAQFIARFQNEARTMAKMNHPAIVGVYDFGETAEGQLYIVMEFIDGTDVAQMIKSAGRLPPDHALAITAHVCDALSYAHDRGVIHRDIKPANILINREGQVKVADFGLAKLDDPSQTTGLTKSNMAMGTPDFVAPEVLTLGVTVDHRADLYAIGVMLYQMLTGEIPRGMFKMPSLKVESDPRFDAIITKAMESEREARYQTAAEIRKDLDRILTTPLVKAGDQQAQAAVPKQQLPQKPAARGPQPHAAQQQEAPAPAPQHAPRSKPKSNAGLFIGLAAAVVLGAIFLFRGKDEPAPKAETSVASSVSTTPVPKPKPDKSPSPTPASTPTPAPKPKPSPAPPSTPAAFSEPVPTLSAKAADILPVVVLPEDAIYGDWAKEGDGLRFNKRKGQRDSHIELPVVCSGSYLLDVEFTPGPQDGTMAMHTPYAKPNAAGHDALTFHLNFGTQGNKSAGFATFPKLKGAAAVSAKVENSTPQRTRVTLKIEIKPANQLALSAWHNGKPIIGWEGDRSVPQGPENDWLPKRPPRFTLGTYTDNSVFHHVRIEPLDGEIQWLRDAASIAKATPTAPAMPASPAASTSGSTPAPSAPTDPVSAKLAELEKTFQDVYEKQVGASHKAAIATLNAQFTAALDRSIVTVSKAGKLEEGLALQNEKKLLQTAGAIADEDAADTPDSLKKLREAYRGSISPLFATREKLAAPVHAGYDRLLATYQDELTRASRLDEAARVKAVREHITAQREASPSVQSSTPATGVAAVPATGAAGKAPVIIVPTAPPLPANKILPPPPKASSEESRAIAEWVLSIGQHVSVISEGRIITARSVQELPKSKITITEVYIYELKEEDMDKTMAMIAKLSDLESLAFKKNRGKFPIEQLRGLTKLKYLEFNPPSLDESAFAHLTNLKALENFAMHGCKTFTGVGLGYLNKDLKYISLGTGALTAEGVAYLGRFKKLTKLNLNDVEGLTDSMLSVVAGMPDLDDLYVPYNRLDGSFLAYLPPTSKLTRLNIGGIATFKHEHFTHLARLKNLQVLEMPPMDPGAAAMAAIAGLDQLKELAFADNRIFNGESFKGLKGFKNLAG